MRRIAPALIFGEYLCVRLVEENHGFSRPYGSSTQCLVMRQRVELRPPLGRCVVLGGHGNVGAQKSVPSFRTWYA